MLVDSCGLRFSETDEVDDVREDLNEPIVGRSEEVIKREVVNAALQKPISLRHRKFPLGSLPRRAVSVAARKIPSNSSYPAAQSPYVPHKYPPLQLA